MVFGTFEKLFDDSESNFQRLVFHFWAKILPSGIPGSVWRMGWFSTLGCGVNCQFIWMSILARLMPAPRVLGVPFEAPKGSKSACRQNGPCFHGQIARSFRFLSGGTFTS